MTEQIYPPRSPDGQYEYERLLAFDIVYMAQDYALDFPPQEGLRDKSGLNWDLKVKKDDNGKILAVSASGGLQSFVITTEMNEARFYDREVSDDEPIATKIDALRKGNQTLKEILEPIITARFNDLSELKVADQGPTGTTHLGLGD